MTRGQNQLKPSANHEKVFKVLSSETEPLEVLSLSDEYSCTMSAILLVFSKETDEIRQQFPAKNGASSQTFMFGRGRLNKCTFSTVWSRKNSCTQHVLPAFKHGWCRDSAILGFYWYLCSVFGSEKAQICPHSRSADHKVS